MASSSEEEEDDEDEEDDSSEEEVVAAAAKPAAAAESSEEDDSDEEDKSSEEDAPAAKSAPKPAAKPAAAKVRAQLLLLCELKCSWPSAAQFPCRKCRALVWHPIYLSGFPCLCCASWTDGRLVAQDASRHASLDRAQHAFACQLRIHLSDLQVWTFRAMPGCRGPNIGCHLMVVAANAALPMSRRNMLAHLQGSATRSGLMPILLRTLQPQLLR